MLSKHTVSIWDLVDDLDQGKTDPPEMWDEKIIGHINYLILLRVLVVEREIKPIDPPATSRFNRYAPCCHNCMRFSDTEICDTCEEALGLPLSPTKFLRKPGESHQQDRC